MEPKTPRGTKVRILVGLLVGALLMALAFWGVPLSSLAGAFKKLKPVYLVPFAALFFLQEVVRAYRQLLLMRPIAPRMKFDSSLSIFFVSYLFIHVCPARLGEIIRPVLLAKREQVSIIACTGVVVTERVVDTLAAALMFVALLLWIPLPERLMVAGHAFHIESTARTAGLLLVAPLLTFALVMALAPGFFLATIEKTIDMLARHLHCAWLARKRSHVGEVIRALSQGFDGLREAGSLALVLSSTVLTWGITASMYWLMAIAFGLSDHVGPGEAFAVMVITLWASVLPAPPGMAGVQEAFGRGALALFGVSGPELSAVALAYAILIHWGQVLLQALGAWFFLIRDGLPIKSVLQWKKQAEDLKPTEP